MYPAREATDIYIFFLYMYDISISVTGDVYGNMIAKKKKKWGLGTVSEFFVCLFSLKSFTGSSSFYLLRTCNM